MSRPLNVLKKIGQSTETGIVFLHGFGANAEDLAPLVEELKWSPKESWYFPDAPLEVPIGPGFWGRAWFPISVRDLESGVDFSNATPPGMDQAVQAVERLIDSLPHQKIILGGFSQGAMVATQLVLSDPSRYKGLVILSGCLVRQQEWRKLAARQKPNFNVFQSHGRQDQMIPVEQAEKLHGLLEETGWEGSFHEFNGGHEIPPVVLKELKSYLRHQVTHIVS